MRLQPRVFLGAGLAMLLACSIGCSGKKKEVKLEITRETVVHSPTISSVVLKPSGRVDTRERGRSLQVEVKGDPGLTASFDVIGRARNLKMTESEPGTYVGSYSIDKGSVGELEVVARLVHEPSGATQEQGAASPLELFLSPPPRPKTCTPEMAREFDGKLNGATAYFKFDNYDVTQEASTKLSEFKEALLSYRLCPVHVLGFADDVGSPKYNLALSSNRAIAVGRFIESLGVPQQRVEKHALGEKYPVAVGEDPSSRARNRRVEVRGIYPY